MKVILFLTLDLIKTLDHEERKRHGGESSRLNRVSILGVGSLSLPVSQVFGEEHRRRSRYIVEI